MILWYILGSYFVLSSIYSYFYIKNYLKNIKGKEKIALNNAIKLKLLLIVCMYILCLILMPLLVVENLIKKWRVVNA